MLITESGRRETSPGWRRRDTKFWQGRGHWGCQKNVVLLPKQGTRRKVNECDNEKAVEKEERELRRRRMEGL